MSTETFLDPVVIRHACAVDVREREYGPEYGTVERWETEVRLPLCKGALKYVLVGLRDGYYRTWPVPEGWQMNDENCKKLAVEFIEQLKKEGMA